MKTIATDLSWMRTTAKKGVSEALLWWRLRGRSRFGRGVPLALPVDFPCFISGDKGVFRLEAGILTPVFPVWTMGMAIADDQMYLSCSGRVANSHSMILKGDLAAWHRAGQPYRFEQLYYAPLISKKHRIHQIAVSGDYLWAANTPRNSLLKINRHTGEVVKEIAPFIDSYGRPILYDNHHINSITVYGDVVLFVAYRIGEQAMIGVCDEKQIRGYAYQNAGVHDIHIRGQDVYFCDTFGGEVAVDRGGRLMKNGHGVAPDFFAEPPGHIVRGMAQVGDQLLVGHSHKGPRLKRFDGPGKLLLLVDGAVTDVAELPFAQVYDILPFSGNWFDTPPAVTGFEGICGLLEGVLGAPVYEVEVTELMDVKGHE